MIQYINFRIACEDGKVRVYFVETREVFKEIKLRDKNENVEMSLKYGRKKYVMDRKLKFFSKDGDQIRAQN